MDAILAINLNNVIGDSGQLMWHIPEDMRFFRYVTEDRTVVMGSKTFRSLGRPNGLPNRKNVVLTTNRSLEVGPDVQLVDSWENLTVPNDAVIIGGATLYDHVIANKMINFLAITLVHDRRDGDTKIGFDFASNLLACKQGDAFSLAGSNWTVEHTTEVCKSKNDGIEFQFVILWRHITEPVFSDEISRNLQKSPIDTEHWMKYTDTSDK